MQWLRNWMARMAEAAQRREQQRYETYLADATDLYELEYRQRAWDREQAQSAAFRPYAH